MSLRGTLKALAVCLFLAMGGLVPISGSLAATAVPEPEGPKVRVELVSAVSAVAPGRTLWVGLHQRITPGWHTYWMNPGDSGEPPRIEWSLPPGFMTGDFVWPSPERLRVGPAMTYGYSGEVVLPLSITVPANLVAGDPVTLRGKASWLVCAEVCIPEEAPISLTLPVTNGAPPPDPRGAALIAAARRASPTASPWPTWFTATNDEVTVTVGAQGLTTDRIIDVWFYPSQWGAIDLAASQRTSVDASGIRIDVARGSIREAASAPIEGVLVVAERLDGGVARHAFSLKATPRAGGEDGQSTMLSLLRAVGLALAGGLVLNLMPCVLPMLSVKALGLVQHSSGRRALLRAHGLAYTAGVLASFAIVAGTLIALRAGGEQLGWGFQLQSPAFVTALAWLFFVLALSLSGVITVSGRFSGAGQALAARPDYAGSFATGALATVAATPCTAPFMGAAVGFAVTQPWPAALLVFETLGLGLALPYLILTLIPGWGRFLPKPGPWMVRLEQFLAFPLYASAAWLVWVVSQQAGSNGVAAALAGVVLIAFACWLHRTLRGAPALWRRAATLAVVAVLPALIVGIVALAPLGAGTRSPAPDSAGGGAVGWEPFSPERLTALRAAGKPVFVNVTAAWCVTCLVNERVALRSPAVAEVFAKKGVVALKADWTTRDPSISRVLGALGRSGVPVYALYPPAPSGGVPTLLPQILTEGAVIDAIDKL